MFRVRYGASSQITKVSLFGTGIGYWPVVPKLAEVSTVALREALGLSKGSCSKVRRGLQVPSATRWAVVAGLAGVEGSPS